MMDISIHALLAESDTRIFLSLTCHQHFYPRSPCGERLAVSAALQLIPLISIHALLAESDDAPLLRAAHFLYISIHALLAESDMILLSGALAGSNFYPRSPCGERPFNFIFGFYAI